MGEAGNSGKKAWAGRQVAVCVLQNQCDRSGQHTLLDMYHRGPCRQHPPVVVMGCCRTLDHRLKEHRRALTSRNLAQSVIAEHAAQESHVIDWKEAKVVDTHPHYHQRCALESWRIRSETTTMNRDDGDLPQACNSLLNYPREPHTSH